MQGDDDYTFAERESADKMSDSGPAWFACRCS